MDDNSSPDLIQTFAVSLTVATQNICRFQTPLMSLDSQYNATNYEKLQMEGGKQLA
jgi:hypothetical protein